MRPFPSEIPGFTRAQGVPVGPQGKSYFSSWEEAVRRCKENPFCVGVSNQRLFVTLELPKSKLATEKGQPGESVAFLKQEFAFCG